MRNLHNYVCTECGSSEIRKQADCSWNIAKQEWEIANYADAKEYCLSCGKNQNAKEIIYEELEKGDGVHCEICGTKVEYLSDLNEYDGLLLDKGYLCCDDCVDKIENSIKMQIEAIRDKQLQNVKTINMICKKCGHNYSYQVRLGYKGLSRRCPNCNYQDPRK